MEPESSVAVWILKRLPGEKVSLKRKFSAALKGKGQKKGLKPKYCNKLRLLIITVINLRQKMKPTAKFIPKNGDKSEISKGI